jgi:hypothetical protein
MSSATITAVASQTPARRSKRPNAVLARVAAASTARNAPTPTGAGSSARMTGPERSAAASK